MKFFDSVNRALAQRAQRAQLIAFMRGWLYTVRNRIFVVQLYRKITEAHKLGPKCMDKDVFSQNITKGKALNFPDRSNAY